MNITPPRPADDWTPLYFLASVGAGGLTVTFFMFLMFWVPHPGQPVPVFEDIALAFTLGGTAQKVAIVVAVAGIAGFAILNVKMLIWNLGRYANFRHSDAYTRMVRSNAATQVLAMPLALAMSVNAGFILGLVFVPGLWSVVEYLFPVAMIAFGLIAFVAFRQVGEFLGQRFSETGLFDVEANTSFAQLLPAFALSMTAVGMAAPAAMSVTPTTVGVSLVLSLGLGTIAALYAFLSAVTAFNAMLKHGVAPESAPTLMIVVPILTILGIMTMRQTHGLHTTFDAHGGIADTLMLTTMILAIQVAFLALGLSVLKRQHYAATFLRGKKSSAGSYALVCPGVALNVMLHFWINKGLVASGLITKFGLVYWGLTSVALAAQIAMIALVLFLNKQHFRPGRSLRSLPA